MGRVERCALRIKIKITEAWGADIRRKPFSMFTGNATRWQLIIDVSRSIFSPTVVRREFNEKPEDTGGGWGSTRFTYRDTSGVFLFSQSTVNYSPSCPFRRDLHLDFARSNTCIIKKKKKNINGKTNPLYPSWAYLLECSPHRCSPHSRQEVSENRGREFYMGFRYGRQYWYDAHKILPYILRIPVFGYCAPSWYSRSARFVSLCPLGNTAKTVRVSDDIDAWWTMAKGSQHCSVPGTDALLQWRKRTRDAFLGENAGKARASSPCRETWPVSS